MPRTLSSLISCVPHGSLLVLHIAACSHGHLHIPSPEIALPDICLPHPWGAFGCITSFIAHRWSKKGKQRANPVILIPIPPSLCFYCQMGHRGTRKVQAWDTIQIQLTSLLWITSRKTYGVAVGSSQKQPWCFSAAGVAPQVVLRGWSRGSMQQPGDCSEHGHEFQGHKKCRGSWSQAQRLCQMSWEHLAESRHQTHTAHEKKPNRPKAWKEKNFLQTILFLQYQQIVLKKYTSSFRRIRLTCSFSWAMFPSPKWMQTDVSMSEVVKNWKIFMGNGSPKEILPRQTLKLNDGKEWCQRGWL